MIKHVVLFKLKDYPEHLKKEILSELTSGIKSLKDKISEAKYIEVGVNHELDAKSYDLALISHFESINDLETYIFHPEHQKISKRLGETTISRAAVDFEF
ncbi:MAG: Dabb family protein [Bacteroidales bacterium]|jgi:hypothetical protein|nr:Dabb family protein [Bacteroidales bacterium]